ncbi:MAG: monovalent cation/H(+) antiporter subunit G [Candidatus Omnitrophica bacterium]|nr:monovalent cation/H(+) antiporter subunit G [Candidatus Omnitrophota bacterium]
MISLIGIIVIAAGLLFDCVGCLGLIRLPDVYNRVQASTKCVVFGTCCILFGTFLILRLSPSGIKCLLAIGFLLLTAPTASHALARAAHKAGVPLSGKSICDEYASTHKEEK